MIASRLRVWTSRAALVGLGLMAMTAGLALGSAGCGWRCRCPEIELEPGVFEIVESPDRPELVGGMVHAFSSVEISFTDAEGDSWVIDYSIAFKQ